MKKFTAINKLKTVRWSFVASVGFFVFVVGFMVQLGLDILNWATDRSELPVQKVMVEGERKYTTDQELRRVLDKKTLDSFLALNVDEVQQRIVALPWVYNASVRKQWPDSLHIYIEEQHPVAIWNGDMVLNVNGEAFQADTKDMEDTVPYLFGPEGSESEALQGYKDMSSLLKYQDIAITELSLSERFAWNAQLDNGVRLALGREDKVKRVQRFMELYPLLEEQGVEHLDYVDLRYDTGAAVGWLDAGKNKSKKS